MCIGWEYWSIVVVISHLGFRRDASTSCQAHLLTWFANHCILHYEYWRNFSQTLLRKFSKPLRKEISLSFSQILTGKLTYNLILFPFQWHQCQKTLETSKTTKLTPQKDVSKCSKISKKFASSSQKSKPKDSGKKIILKPRTQTSSSQCHSSIPDSEQAQRPKQAVVESIVDIDEWMGQEERL